ncbi:hypothetical protein MBLNU230_g6711t1 [Neophaeotheca triangularis]
MDVPNTRPQLPALSYLDHEKVKREEDAYQNRNTCAPQTMPIPSLAASPVQHGYPPGPPPPYSHPGQPPAQQYANNLPAVQTGRHSPLGSHQAGAENEKENIKQTVRQSLPSISEALGVDGASYSTAPPAQQPEHASLPQSAAPPSPSATVRHSHIGMEPQQQHQHTHYNASTYPPHHAYPSEPAQHQSQLPHDTPRAGYAPDPIKAQPHHIHTQQSPAQQHSQHPSSQHYTPRPSPSQEQSNSQSNGTMRPPATFPYGYTSYPQRYAPPTPSSNVTHGPIYQPSSTYAAPPTSTPAWASSDSGGFRPQAERQYGDSVKRHLDLYDMESALTDISSTSRIVLDFSGRYSDRMHSTVRSGPTPSTLPGMIEIDDMVNKSRVQLESLLKIREVVLAQQAAYEQQAIDQRDREQQAKPSFAPPEHHQPGPHHGQLERTEPSEDGRSVGFAGSDPKKRRGRAAPPGRCHSCNRAETPEWRRGPDGARTLCNACGLHYAKLTRKANNAASKNASAAAGSSNLRPKESGGA